MKLKGRVDQKNKSEVEVQEKKEREQKSENEAKNNILKETTKPPKGIDEATSDNIGRLLHDKGVVGSKDDCDNGVMEFKDECDNGVMESKDECDSEVLPEMKDDRVKYPVDGKSLIVRPALQAQIKIDTFDQQFELDVQETTREEEIQQMILLVHKKSHFVLRKTNNSLPGFTISLLQELEDKSSKKMSSRLPPIRDIAHQLHFILGVVGPKRSTNRSNSDETNELPIHQIKANKGCRFIFDPGDWIWIHVKGLYPFYAGSDLRSNPFEEG
ncbi:Uncharacterized protein Adt_03152 [Abeliophyllum distichum]|uniref:Uncharacterized protein n=1 Tax=Abeliophyllum distichum TaxID=126358 RepID=A0ABD1VXQ4_9LAMI